MKFRATFNYKGVEVSMQFHNKGDEVSCTIPPSILIAICAQASPSAVARPPANMSLETREAVRAELHFSISLLSAERNLVIGQPFERIWLGPLVERYMLHRYFGCWKRGCMTAWHLGISVWQLGEGLACHSL